MNASRPNTPARTIDDVLAELDRIVEESLASGDRLGYFAALYRKVTRKVKEGIASGYFEDGPRMERLDVVFADRYLDALAACRRGDKPTLAWQLAFAAAGRWRPLILQQLLVGINAHINLDLGISAATIAPGSSLAALRTDFDRINEILFSPVAEVENTIEQKDRLTTLLGEEVLSPGPILRWGLMLIRMRESNDVRRVIQLLAAMPEPELATLEASRLAKYQTTVPHEVRQSLGAQPSDAHHAVVEGDQMQVAAATPAFLSLQGKFKVDQGDVVKDVKQVRDSMEREPR